MALNFRFARVQPCQRADIPDGPMHGQEIADLVRNGIAFGFVRENLKKRQQLVRFGDGVEIQQFAALQPGGKLTEVVRFG